MSFADVLRKAEEIRAKIPIASNPIAASQPAAPSLSDQLNAEYEAELASRVAATPPPAPTIASEFVKGVKQGTIGLAEMVGGVTKFAGDVTGINPISEVGRETLDYWKKQNEPNTAAVGSYEDVNSVKDAALYAAHGVGSLFPTVAASMAGGGIGGAAAKKAGMRALAAGVAEAELSKDIATQIAKKTLTGFATGAGAASYGMELGSIYGDQADQGIEDPASAAFWAIPAAAMDVIPETRIVAKWMKPLTDIPALASDAGKKWYRRGITEAFKQGGVEGATEFAQTLMEQKGALRELDTKEAINAGIIGALGGGFMGGTTGVFAPHKVTEVLNEKAKNPDANIEDLIGQVSANEIGSLGLDNIINNDQGQYDILSQNQEGLSPEEKQALADENLLRRVEREAAFNSQNPAVNPLTGEPVANPEVLPQPPATPLPIPEAQKLLPETPTDTHETAAMKEATRRLSNVAPLIGDTLGDTLKNISNSEFYNKKGKEGTLDRAALDADLKTAGLDLEGLRAVSNPDIKLADEIIGEAEGWYHGKVIIDGHQAEASYSNKFQIFPWLEGLTSETKEKVKDPVTGKTKTVKSVWAPTPGDVIAALEAFKKGERKLGPNQQLLVDTALAEHKAKLEGLQQAEDQQLLDERTAIQQETGDTSFGTGQQSMTPQEELLSTGYVEVQNEDGTMTYSKPVTDGTHEVVLGQDGSVVSEQIVEPDGGAKFAMPDNQKPNVKITAMKDGTIKVEALETTEKPSPITPEDVANIAAVMSEKLGVEIKPEELSFTESDDLTNLVSPFGAAVSMFSYSGNEVVPDGFVIPGTYGNRIFVHDQVSQPVHAVLGHEMIHQMAVNAPELYQELLDYIKANTNDKAFADYEKWIRSKQAYATISAEEMQQEYVGNLAANAFNTKSFWEKMAARSPELFGKLIRFVKTFTATVYQYFKGAENSVRDVEKVNTKIGEIFEKYAEKFKAGKFPVDVQGGMQAEVAMPEAVKPEAATTPEINFSMPEEAVASLNKLGQLAMNPKEILSSSKVSEIMDRMVSFLMPLDRFFDWFKNRKALAPVKDHIEELTRQAALQTGTMNGLQEQAGRVINKVYDAVGETTKGWYKVDQAKLDKFQKVMALARTWMMVADESADNQPVKADTWATLGMEERTGRTWEEAHKELTDLYDSMTPAMKAAYDSVRKLNKQAYDKQRQLNIDMFANNPNLSEETKKKQIARVEKMFAERKGDYFTLGRSGKYVLEIKESDVLDEDGEVETAGKRLISMSFENQLDWERAIEAFDKDAIGESLKNSEFSREYLEGLRGLEVMHRFKQPINRATTNIPLTFIEKLTELASSVTVGKELVAFRKEVRKLRTDLKQDMRHDPDLVISDGIQAKLEELSHAQSVAEAKKLQGELQALADQAKLDEEFLADAKFAIDQMGYSDEVANSLKEQFHQQWLSSLPESSIMRNFVKSKNMEGYSKDMMRSFAQYHQKHARAVAFITHGQKIQKLLADMDKVGTAHEDAQVTASIGNFTNMMRDRQAAILGEKVNPIVRNLTKVPFIWYMTSPSTMLVQSTQPFTVTVPFLGARFGLSRSLSSVFQNYSRQIRGEFKNEKILEFEEKHRELIDAVSAEINEAAAGFEGRVNKLTKGLNRNQMELLGMILTPTLSIGLSHETMQFAQEGTFDKNSFTKKLGFFMETAETASRKAAYAAAFNLKYQESGDFAKSAKFANDAVHDTLYDYSATNRPQILSGNAGRLFGQFRIYQVHTAFKLMKLGADAIKGVGLTPEEQKAAQKELAMNLGMNFALAGSIGLPGMGIAMTVASLLHSMFGDDDEPWDAEMEFNKMLRGTAGGSVLGHGLPALFGMDLSRRIGAGGVFSLFQNSPPENKKGTDLAAWYALQVAGPSASIATTMMNSYEAMKKGDWGQAAQLGMPGLVKGLVRAGVTAEQGMKSGTGQTLIPASEISPWEIILMGVGLNPIDLSLKSEEQKLESNYSAQINERRSRLQGALVDATLHGTQADVEQAIEGIVKYNQSVPLFAFKGSELATGIKDAIKKDMGILSKKQQKLKIGYGGE